MGDIVLRDCPENLYFSGMLQTQMMLLCAPRVMTSLRTCTTPRQLLPTMHTPCVRRRRTTWTGEQQQQQAGWYSAPCSHVYLPLSVTCLWCAECLHSLSLVGLHRWFGPVDLLPCRFMGSVVGILQQYTAAAANGAQPEAALARRMDGSLLAIGVMSDILKAKVGSGTGGACAKGIYDCLSICHPVSCVRQYATE
jgi:hypothetical protein